MRKFASLAVVLMLVLCLATTAFAAAGDSAAEPLALNPGRNMVSVAAGASTFVEVDATAADTNLTVVVAAGSLNWYIVGNRGPIYPNMGGEAAMAIPADGKVVVEIVNADTENPVNLMAFVEAVLPGSMNNPDTLVLGSNVAAATAEGYFYNYTAADYGVLVLNMSGDNWIVTINNLTAGTYGDAVFASDGVSVVAVAVEPGDELQIVLGTEDWTAANISFTAAEQAHLTEHFEPNGATCHERGNVEYWYCSYCDTFYLDEACTQITNALSVYTPATGSENVDHYEANEAECHSRGNVEYWYCNDCDRYFLDEACTQLTNALSIWVGELGSENVQHIDAVTPECHSIGNVEYWYCADCDGYFLDEACTQLTNSHSVILPATGSENVTHVEKVDPNCHVNGMQEHWYCEDCNGYFTDAETTHEAFYRDLIIPAEVTMDYYEAVEAGCHNNGNIEHWFCPECEGFYLDAFGIRPTNSLSVILPATGATTVTHYEAVEAYCHRNGMLEHWVCDDCGNYFTDAECTQQVMQPRYLIIPAEVSLEYHEKVNATCVENGMEEYWYCAECDCYFTDAEGIFNIASKRLVIEADGTDHVLEHHAAADPVCHKNGNVEYWYCAECDCYFIDVEGNLVNTNAKNVVILAEETLKHTAKVDATCTENGMQEHWYCENCDCYFTDAEGKFNIARLSLVIPAAGHNYVNGECTECGSDNPQTGDAGFMGAVATMLASAMSTVALVIKKKEF